ncbi:glycosyltransferase WbuB [Nonlabens sp. MB-3u-79]|uniref:glycosyltransferase family 4 protein n=1 Tax=Nonlabens sp. MB-3u-79 TaxID=2058134 RepID=UPI000C30EBF1|nr:glycosyltransferase family 4 protein [Nonlabens sp. MB-3u-79]AUC79548.1 glycosyltransferase WbuB [Nonlabens sp. MB-3u-79]
MRILLIHQYFLEKNDGGGSRFNEMTRTWAIQGHTVTVLAGMVHYATGEKAPQYKGKFTLHDYQFYDGVDVMRCHVSETYNSSFLGRLWAYFSFVFSSVYAGLFKTKGKFDVILVTSPPLFVGITAYVLSIFKRIPFMFEVRDLWPESAIDTGVLQNKIIIKFAYWFEAFIYRKAKLINVLTPAFRTKLIEKGVSEQKIIFIPNAADFSLAEAVQKDFNAQEFKESLGLTGKFVITYVGAHGVANHLIQLLDAAEFLRDTNVVFQLIGSGMQKQMLIAEKEKRQLDNVIFREPVAKAEVFKYILASDMGASVLKKVDTFKTIYSNKTFDYMSCKKATLLAIDGVSRELINEANCGVYVEPENPSAIAAGIRRVLNDPNKLIEMGENGYNHALQNFDRKVLASRYLDHMKTVIK